MIKDNESEQEINLAKSDKFSSRHFLWVSFKCCIALTYQTYSHKDMKVCKYILLGIHFTANKLQLII